jgi:hypothetical protein
MARIKNQILGDVSGTIGPVVYKQIGKTQYVAKKPNSFIPGTDPASIFRRDQCAFVGKLSSKIYSIDTIKKLWSPAVKNQSRIYQRIWTENYHAANCDNLDIPAKLAPVANFIVSNPSFLFEEKSFYLKTDPLGTASGINLAKEKFILACGVIVLKEPIPPAISPLEIIRFKGKNEILDLSSELNLNIDLPSPEDVIYMHYQFRKCYLILITLDKNENPVSSSECLLNRLT